MKSSDFNRDIEQNINSYLPLQLSDNDLRKAFIKEFLDFDKKFVNNEIEGLYFYCLLKYIENFVRKVTIMRLLNKNYYIKEHKIRFKINKVGNSYEIEIYSEGIKIISGVYVKNKMHFSYNYINNCFKLEIVDNLKDLIDLVEKNY